jgi:hypothetical protein
MEEKWLRGSRGVVNQTITKPIRPKASILVDLNLHWLYTSPTGAISYGGGRHALSGLAAMFRFG